MTETGAGTKIVLVSGSLPEMSCGVGDYTNQLARALDRRGIPVVVITGDEKAITDPGYAVCRLHGGWGVARVAPLVRAILRWSPTVVHVQYPAVGYRAGPAPLLSLLVLRFHRLLRRRGPRLVLTLHEYRRFSILHQLLARLTATGVDIVVAPDRRELESAIWSLPLGQPTIAEVPVASNLDVPEREPVTQPQELAVPGRPLIVGTWGFLRPDKGFPDLLTAFEGVIEQTDARLIVAGDPGPDAAYVASIRRIVAESPASRFVEFTGRQSQPALAATLRGLDVCVLPFVDGLSSNRTTYVGAAQLGVYVVTTSLDRNGFDPNSFTYFVPPGDIRALQRAIHFARQLSGHASDAAPHLSWAEIAQRHLKLYAESS